MFNINIFGYLVHINDKLLLWPVHKQSAAYSCTYLHNKEAYFWAQFIKRPDAAPVFLMTLVSQPHNSRKNEMSHTVSAAHSEGQYSHKLIATIMKLILMFLLCHQSLS